MVANEIQSITNKIDKIPTLPTVAMQVIDITSNPNSSAKDLMDIISPDISLTTKILKISNSPFYGLTREITSLQHALTILGFKEIRDLVISTVVFDSFKNIRQNAKFDIKKFWKHSFICGLAAKVIATDLKKKSNEFFVAGLIHDIGKLIMYIAIPREYIRLIESSDPIKLKFMIFELEENTFGANHGEVGMKLLKKWMFPDSLLNAVGFHHRPQKTGNNDLLPMVIHIADILTHFIEMQDRNMGDDTFKCESLYKDIIKGARPYGIDWNESDLKRIQQTIVESIQKEAGSLSLFF